MRSAALGVAYCTICICVWRVSNACSGIYQLLNLRPDWRSGLIEATHLDCAMPVGVILASAILLKDRCFLPATAARLNMGAFVFLLLFFFTWFYAVLSPIFRH